MEITQIPWGDRTVARCEEAILHGAEFSLQDIPYDSRSKLICDVAIQIDCSQIADVPMNLVTSQMCTEVAMDPSDTDLRWIPERFLTTRMCRIAVGANANNFFNVPLHFIDRFMCMDAIRQDPCTISQVPMGIVDREMCENAVEKWGGAITCVPEAFMDQGLVRKAVASDPMSIVHVPDKYLDKESYLVALSHPHSPGLICTIWNRMPEHLKHDPKLVEIAVRQGDGRDGSILEWVREDMRTRPLCQDAVTRWGGSLPHVPAKLRDVDMCFRAITSVHPFPQAILSITPSILTSSMCIMAVRHCSMAILHVPPQYLTPRICMDAVQHIGCGGCCFDVALQVDAERQQMCGGWAITIAPMEYRDESLYLAALETFELSTGTGMVYETLAAFPSSMCTHQTYHSAIQRCLECYALVPAHRRSRQIIKRVLSVDACFCLSNTDPAVLTDSDLIMAVSMHHKALSFVSPHRRTAAICMAAIKKNGLSMRYIDENKRTLEMCLVAIRSNRRAIVHVPAKHLSKYLYGELIQAHGIALKYVPPLHIDEDMCKRVVMKDYRAIWHVPTRCESEKLYRIAIRGGLSLSRISRGKLTMAMCREAINICGGSLRHVPMEWRTHLMSWMAVRSLREAWMYVPLDVQEDLRMCANLRIACTWKDSSLSAATMSIVVANAVGASSHLILPCL